MNVKIVNVQSLQLMNNTRASVGALRIFFLVQENIEYITYWEEWGKPSPTFCRQYFPPRRYIHPRLPASPTGVNIKNYYRGKYKTLWYIFHHVVSTGVLKAGGLKKHKNLVIAHLEHLMGAIWMLWGRMSLVLRRFENTVAFMQLVGIPSFAMMK